MKILEITLSHRFLWGTWKSNELSDCWPWLRHLTEPFHKHFLEHVEALLFETLQETIMNKSLPQVFREVVVSPNLYGKLPKCWIFGDQQHSSIMITSSWHKYSQIASRRFFSQIINDKQPGFMRARRYLTISTHSETCSNAVIMSMMMLIFFVLIFIKLST